MKTGIEEKAAIWAVLAAAVAWTASWLLAGQIAGADESRIMASAASASVPVLMVPAAGRPDLIVQGGTFFGLSCSHCHADDASGDEGPDLRHLALSDARIATTIRKGIKGEMPSFEKKYNEEQVKALVSYLRSLK